MAKTFITALITAVVAADSRAHAVAPAVCIIASIRAIGYRIGSRIEWLRLRVGIWHRSGHWLRIKAPTVALAIDIIAERIALTLSHGIGSGLHVALAVSVAPFAGLCI